MENRLGPDRFANSFDSRVRFSFHDGAVEVASPTKAISGLLERRFAETIRQAAIEELGREVPLLTVRFVVADAPQPDGPSDVAALAAGHEHDSRAPSNGTVHKPSARRPSRFPTTDRMRLDSFVVGESNRLVYNAAVQMAEGQIDAAVGTGQGLPYRHLFIHGPCGVGKTHLLQGIALRFKERHPGAVMRLTSGEQFMSEFVASIRAGGSGSGSGAERFRKQYRRVDMLCIDDVHFLASKQATQSELLHTFDEIERAGARVVLVSDEHPRLLKKFSPALVSRFMAGMVAGLGAPDGELRDRMVRVFGRQRGLELDDAAVAVLVERTGMLPGGTPVTVRELEGHITRIEALYRLLPEYASIQSGRIGAALVQRALGGSDPADGTGSARSARPVRIDDIIRSTCAAVTVDPRDLSGKTRHVRVVLARALITHLARSMTTLSFPEIAKALGRPNHSTVITAHQRIQKQLAADEPVDLPDAPETKTIGAVLRQLTIAVHNAARR